MEKMLTLERSIVSTLICQRTTSLKIMTPTFSLLLKLVIKFQMNMLFMRFDSKIRNIYMTLKRLIQLMIEEHSQGKQLILSVKVRFKCMTNILSTHITPSSSSITSSIPVWLQNSLPTQKLWFNHYINCHQLVL